ncbi:acetyl-CoA C-acyltransferase [Cohnella sp. CFH 77786]|uniref:thiolase family protein n=1 Tax=Cohnella sp. CFH 77786 TaxID=2662265 RepID=UPI001C60B44A|nr:thiolase family protein [Cohnella sp. CFH 77786]MBW5445468.1 acetyl-CoA C-acyltransferase [Cohnella sp. CFH 77786]
MREAVIVSAVRTPVGRAGNGMFRELRAEDLGSAVLKETIRRLPGWQSDGPDDCVLGIAAAAGDEGRNLARMCALLAGFPVTVPAMTVNRSCASGLQAVALGAAAVAAGAAETLIAGGVESMSRRLDPVFANPPHPELLDRMASAYISPGHTAELAARRYGVSREAQDRYASESRRKAAEAAASGRFRAEIVPLNAVCTRTDGEGRPSVYWSAAEEDECPGRGPDPDLLAGLAPAYAVHGTVTEGNSAPPGDGAAALLLTTRERAARMGVRPLAAVRGYAVSALPPEMTGLGPVYAVPNALKHAGLQTRDISLWELHEASAAETVPLIDRLEIDPSLVNVNGGSIALGHPVGCTGARLTVSLVHELSRRGGGLGVAAVGARGGMGAACVFEVYGTNGGGDFRGG